MRAIGQGGVSTVYSAVDAHHGRRLAVKVLAPTLADDPGARDDVRREALITDRLRHPGVPRVFEYGDAPLPDGTVVPYVVLELLSGVPLTDVLSRGPLHWPEAVRIAATVAEVLAVAHDRGVVHRDLTPRNVMITPNCVKIIDFGLATAALRDADTASRPIVIRSHGPVGDLPSHPKTAFARPADDVYTLGVLLYEMLVGRSPYPPSMAATILASGRAAHLAPTPVLAVPGLAAEVRDLVRDCMAKNPADRPASAAVAHALWSVLARRGVRLPEASVN
jgi:serine/threonine-protein kinase